MTAAGPRLPPDARFRANPAYELVLYDRLSAGERRALAPLEDAPDLYGVLRPRDGASGPKSVSREAALLYLTLAEPGPLPRYLARELGARAERAVAALVLDEVLEVEIDGVYVCGTAAAAAFAPAAPGEPEDTLARLSLDALRYAAALPEQAPHALAERLYAYHRLPLTPRWAALARSEDAVAGLLGLDDEPPPAAHWRAIEAPPQWHVWTRATPLPGVAQRPSHKLYVSPRPDWIAPAFDATVAALTASRALSFKVARTGAGLLRPDKLVAYFAGREPLDAAAADLAERLSGVPAHGVPFTAALDDRGLLSWGMDPPDWHELSPWRRESWRLWIARRLAVALLQARRDPAIEEPWRFALSRLALEGVDCTTWAPGELAWAAA